jgi:hypothetical protein
MKWNGVSLKTKKLLIFLSGLVGFVLLTGFVKEAADIFAGLNLVTDTIADINDATVEEELIRKQLSAFDNQERDLEESLREFDYTETEIKEILGADVSSGQSNTLLVLRRAAQNVKRAKELIKRIKTAGQINPDVATAGYTAISAKSLSDIKVLLAQVIYNQNRDYQGRLLEKAREKHDWDKTRKMLHSESLRVRLGKPERGQDNHKPSDGKPSSEPTKTPASNIDSHGGIHGRIKSWWSGGKD